MSISTSTCIFMGSVNILMAIMVVVSMLWPPAVISISMTMTASMLLASAMTFRASSRGSAWAAGSWVSPAGSLDPSLSPSPSPPPQAVRESAIISASSIASRLFFIFMSRTSSIIRQK